MAEVLDFDPTPARADVDLMALDFLARSGRDAVGVIDSEEKMAAALVFIGLEKRGLARSVRRETGPFYTITDAGRAALARQDGGQP